MAPPTRFERMAFRLGGERSIRLSYGGRNTADPAEFLSYTKWLGLSTESLRIGLPLLPQIPPERDRAGKQYCAQGRRSERQSGPAVEPAEPQSSRRQRQGDRASDHHQRNRA